MTNTPNMQPVDSSNVHSCGWDRETFKLHIRFKNGRTYTYADVPHEVFTQLLAAESVGKYFNKHIKDRYVMEEI